MVPQELAAAYVEIVKNEPNAEAAAAHLVAFVNDAQDIAQSVQQAISDAKARAGQSVPPPPVQ